MNHPSDSLFNAMRAVVEAPGYPLLRNYQQDFYKYDREILRSTWTQDMSYLWIVRGSGTHLYPLYLDPSIAADANAALAMSGESECYLLGPGRLEKIGLDRARRELQRLEYEVVNRFVMKNGSRLMCRINISLRWEQGQQKGYVSFAGDLGIDNLTPKDRVALRYIAIGQAHAISSSLFTPCAEIVYNGQPLTHSENVSEEACAA